MQTKILAKEELSLAISALRNGNVVAIPTETVYGLAARLDNETAIEKIFYSKQRPQDNPLIVHIASMDMVADLAVDIPKSFYQLADAFFPGPLTLVLRKNPLVSDQITAGQSTIAIRMPYHELARKIIEKVGVPLVAPSANLSGKPSPTTSLDVYEDMKGKIPYIVEGGRSTCGIESTIVDLSSDQPRLLRPGSITKKEIEKVLQSSLEKPLPNVTVPGMKYRHYSPTAKVLLFDDFMNLLDYEKTSSKKKVILSQKEGHTPFSATNIFSLFRIADRMKIEEILIDCSEVIEEGLINRLTKASSQ